jgi:hypothetical protein
MDSKEGALMSQAFKFAALGALLTLLTADIAAAQTSDLGGYRSRRRREPPAPQWQAELRFGPYSPNVDQEFSGATPFADTFGDGTRFLFGFEVDWLPLVLPRIARIGPGIGVGYTKMSGNARLDDGSGQRADQETSLAIAPFYLVAVGRVDVLARNTPVPLSPYVKAGLGYAFWWASDGDDTARSDGIVGRDASYGYHLALGAALGLGFLDLEGGGSMEAQDASVFFEWYLSELSGFGSGNQMNVGTSTWTLGLGVQF